MRGYFMALDARSGEVLWRFQTGSGIIGSPITYELDGTQYVAVPSGGIGGDMIFYYTEPRAGNLWVFALDGGPRDERQETNLTPLPGGLPRVGEPGHTLGGRVLPGYGFEPTEGSDPITTTPPTLPGATAAPAAADAPAADDARQPLAGRCGRSRRRRADLSLALHRLSSGGRRSGAEPVPEPHA